MGVILIILIGIIIVLFVKNHGLKRKINELSKQNKELNRKIELISTPVQDDLEDVNNSENHEEPIDLDKTKQDEQASGQIVESDASQSETKHHIDIPVSVTVTMDNDEKIDDDPYMKEYEEQNKLYDKFQKIEATRPDYRSQFGRPFDSPKYTDKYDTHTDFSLRELLLLVWWGRIKKGRLTTARIPKYFIYDYNLNTQKTTQKFIDKGWLIKKDDRYFLSKEARQAADFYDDLWDMHKYNGFPICLDDDFPNWNHGKLLITFYKDEIEFQNKMIDFYNKEIAFYEKNPKYFSDKQSQKDRIEYTKKSILNAQNDIDTDKNLIAAIE